LRAMLAPICAGGDDGAGVESAPTMGVVLFAIAAMLQMANLEADLAYLFTSLMQSFAGVVIYFGVFRFLVRRRSRSGARGLDVSIPLWRS